MSHILVHKKTLYCIGTNNHGECDIPFNNNFETGNKYNSIE